MQLVNTFLTQLPVFAATSPGNPIFFETTPMQMEINDSHFISNRVSEHAPFWTTLPGNNR